MIRILAAAAVLCLGGTLAPPRVAAQSATAAAPAATPPAGPMVNINTADAAGLAALPGVGAKTADLIIAYRKANGPFKKIEELMNVRGIGEKSFLKLRPQITVGTPKAAEGGAK
jgi:competence protein ComEA